MLLNGRILMDREACEVTTAELEDYRWNPKAAAMGVERPLKQVDHSADALRYAVSTLWSKISTRISEIECIKFEVY